MSVGVLLRQPALSVGFRNHGPREPGMGCAADEAPRVDTQPLGPQAAQPDPICAAGPTTDTNPRRAESCGRDPPAVRSQAFLRSPRCLPSSRLRLRGLGLCEHSRSRAAPHTRFRLRRVKVTESIENKLRSNLGLTWAGRESGFL